MDVVCGVAGSSLENAEFLFSNGWADYLFQVTEFNLENPDHPDILISLNKMELLVKV